MFAASRFVSVAVALLLAQSVVAAGKESKAQPPKGAAKTAAGAASQAPSAPVAPPPFAPVVFREGDDVRAWMANNPKKVFDWIEDRIAKVPNKADKFSTREERQAYESAVHDALSSVGQLPFVFPCPKAYNADAQAFEVMAIFFGIKGSEVATRGLSGVGHRDIRIGTENRVVSTYTAQNGFGASFDVTKTEADVYSIAVPEGIAHGPAELQPGSFGTQRDALPGGVITYHLPVPMSSADARLADGELACAALVTLMPPFATEFARVSPPTRDMRSAYHYKVHAFVAKLDRFMVVNKATGQVYLEFKRY